MSSLSSIALDKAGRLWLTADEQLIVSEDNGNTWKIAAKDSNMFLTRLFHTGDTMWGMGELGLLKQTAKADGMEWKPADNFAASGTTIADTEDSAEDAPTPQTPASPAAK